MQDSVRDIVPSRNHVLTLWTILLCGLSLPSLAAAGPGPITDSDDHYPLGASTYFFPDSIEWQAVAGSPLHKSEHNESYLFTLDDYALPVWARVDLSVGDISEGKWLLDTGNAFGGRLTFFTVVNGELTGKTEVNSYESFDSRPYDHRNVMFPLELKAHTEVQLLLKLEGSVVPIFVPALHKESTFITSDRKRTWFEGISMGLLLGMMLYHLILASATFDKIYVTYSLYIGTSALFGLVQKGFGYQYLWPDSPWVETVGGPYFYYLPAFFAILFTVQFLHLPDISKGLTRFFYGAFALLALLLGLRLSGAHIHLFLLSATVQLIFLSFIPAAVYALCRGATYARFFLVAWTVYCVAIANWLFAVSDMPALVPDKSYLLVQFSFAAQIMLLALALAHRIRALREDKLAAEADNNAKSAFLARMSHEIRTPLSGVLGMSELLADRLKDDTDLYYNNIIRSSGTSLLTIINDILDYSKFSSGSMELETIPFSIQRLAVDSLDIFKVQATEKNVELIADIDLDLPPFVQGDPTRVKQVMLNFISNAVKFTSAGQVVLSVKSLQQSDGMIKIAVSDSGEGIAEDEQSKLFEAFAQANSATSRKHGGTGLGLSICKQLAAIMGGDIGMTSELGKGSTFWMTAFLPNSNEANPHLDVDSISISGYRLLIVEDNYTFASLLETQATAWGMQTSLAHNGIEALEILRSSHDQGITFDLISLDLVMPKMDGLETSRCIQLDDRFNKIPRLLLTSANNFPSQSHLSSAGIRKVAEKPTLPSDLLKVYKELLASDQHQREKTSADTGEGSQLVRLRILIVEDNPVNQMVITGILKRLNQETEVVADGEDAVERIIEQRNEYDLVLMDCEMKRMDGVTATKHIRCWERESGLTAMPIVALTAHAVQSQIDACREAGMNAYLTKPVEIAKLETLLRAYATDRQYAPLAMKEHTE